MLLWADGSFTVRALVPLRRGIHIIDVDPTGVFGTPELSAHLTYKITRA